MQILCCLMKKSKFYLTSYKPVIISLTLFKMYCTLVGYILIQTLYFLYFFFFRIVLICLNGKHYDQINLGRGNKLFIIGFDKNVGKIINSFIKEDF